MQQVVSQKHPERVHLKKVDSGKPTPIDRTRELEQVFGSDLDHVHLAFGGKLSTLSNNDFEQITKFYRKLPRTEKGAKYACNVFREDKGDELLEAIPKINKILSILGDRSIALLKSFSLKMAELTKKQLLELGRIAILMEEADVEKDIEAVYEQIHPVLFRSRPRLYEWIVKKAEYNALSAVSELGRKPRIGLHAPKFLMRTARGMGPYTGDTIKKLNLTMLQSHKELVSKVLPYCGSTTEEVLTILSPIQNGDSIVRHVRRYGKALTALVNRFQSRYFEEEKARRDIIREIRIRVKGGAYEFFKNVPPELWDNPKMLEAAEFYEEATGPEYAARGERFFDHETPELCALRAECKREFGIKNFHRLSWIRRDGQIETGVLERNLENLRQQEKWKKNFAVFLLALEDHNQYMKRATSRFCLFHSKYTGFILESGTLYQTAKLLRKIACLRGTNNFGDPLKPVQHITFSNHAHRYEMCQGYAVRGEAPRRDKNPKTLPASYISSFDYGFLEEISRYIATDGTIVLDACETAQGGATGRNLATTLKFFIPHAKIFASQESAPLKRYIFNDKSHVIATELFNPKTREPIPRERTVTL